METPKPSLLLSAARGALWAALALLLLGSLGLLRYRLASRSRERLSRYDAAPREGRFVKAGDVELFVLEAGPAKGRAVLLVHGLAGWSGTWSETLKALAARKLRAIAVDMPPLGYSQRPDDGSYSDQAQARRLAALLDALGVSRAAVVGHSFGTRAAVALALAQPKRVTKLVLADAALPAPGAFPAAPPAAARAVIAAAPLRDALVAATLANPDQTRRVMSFFVADPAAATDERVDTIRRPLVVRGTVEAFGRFLETAAAPSPAPDYRKLAAPTLLLWGEADTVTPLSAGTALQKAIQGSTLRVIPRAGHLLPIEDAPDFDAALLEFLTGKKVLGSGHATYTGSSPSGPRARRPR